MSGKRGAEADIATDPLGSHLERVVRSLKRPLLITPKEFSAPRTIMLAFDGSATTRKGIEMVGADTAETRTQRAQSQQILEKAGFTAPSVILAGEVEKTLRQYQQEQQIDMVIMGAYGHSRIRQLLIGSTTTEVIRKTDVPLLLLR